MKVYILRGVSGSGKSTFAAKWVREVDARVFSTDNYFMKDGKYDFNKDLLSLYHNRNLLGFTEYLIDFSDTSKTVIVDNTNLRMFEIAPYYRLAEAFDCDPEIIWFVASNPVSVHGVTNEMIESQTRNIESIPSWWKMRIQVRCDCQK